MTPRAGRLNALPNCLCACLWFLCACGSDRSGNEEAGAPTEILWSMDSVVVEKEARGIATVDTIWAAQHDGYDRLVIAFEDAVFPGYRAEYVPGPAMHCGSGNAITIGGGAVLELRLEPAKGHDEDGRSTVGHDERVLGLPGLLEVEVSCDFEAVLTLALGVRGHLPFRIYELSDPARLVLEIQTAIG